MNYVSLFSGCGGIDLALDRAGMTCVLQAEIDAQAASVLRRHWPEKKRVRDVRLVRRSRSLRGIDLVAGGFPCQDLSVAGKRAGLDGERSGLWWEFKRIIGEFLPKYVLIENVPGLLSSAQGRDFAIILSGLGELGYGWAYRILDAQYDGVPQRRRRVFIVGCAGGRIDRAAQILFESNRLPWHPAPSRETGTRVAASLTAGVASGRGVNRPGRRREDDVNLVGSLCSHSKEHGHAMGTQQAAENGQLIPSVAYACNGKTGKRYDGESETFVPVIARCLDAGRDGYNDGSDQTYVPVAFNASDYASGAFEESECSRPITTTADRSRAAPLIAFAQNSRDEVRELGGNIAGALSAQPGMKQQTYVAFKESQSGLRIGEVHATLDSNKGSRRMEGVMSGYGVRRLMPIECERCQGMPDDWTRYGVTEDGKEVELSDSARYRLIGNSVAIPTVEWIGRRLIAAADDN